MPRDDTDDTGGHAPQRTAHHRWDRADFEEVRRRAALRVTSVAPLAGAAPYSPIEAVAD